MQSVNRKYLAFQHPFTCMLAGPTSSGKTVLTRDIIVNHNKTFWFEKAHPDELKILWAYGQWQEFYNEIIPNCKINYIDGLPNEEEIDEISPHLIIIDDLMSELADNKNLTKIFTKGSHHKNISVIFITQNVFHQGSQMRTISLNSHYFLLMKNPRDQGQIVSLANQVFNRNRKFLIEAYFDATKNQYSYIRVDMRQNTPDKYRVQTDIIPINGVLSPTVYCLR